MMNRSCRGGLMVVVCLLIAAGLQARVISYAPYTDKVAFVAHQSRTNRHFALVEAAPYASQSAPQAASYGQLVLYDSTGADEPRVIFPADPQYAVFTAVAVREADDGTPVIFAQIYQPADNANTSYFSNDGGKSWKTLDVPGTGIPQLGSTGSDNGGPFASYRYSQIRIGTSDFPFVVATNGALYSVSNIGLTREIYRQRPTVALLLAGRNAAGTKFLVRTPSQLLMVDLNGAAKTVLSSFSSMQPMFEGFITPDDSVYVEERSSSGTSGAITYVHDGQRSALFGVRWTDFATPSSYVVPSADSSSAWVIERGSGRPTVLYRVTAGSAEKMWEDITAPDVEALHAGSSGNKLLIQTHRPRPAVDQRPFKDPALAVWRVGDIAPRVYDELFMNEQWNKGFVHLDVEQIENGEPFVFDSGAMPMGGGGGIIVSPPTSGGGDVTQEWGVVRASLRQRLVLPTVGRTKGAYGSDWVSDVVIQNPLPSQQHVALRFVASGTTTVTDANVTTLALEPNEIRMIPDVVGSLFGIDSTVGALFITPESGVTVTSRTYSRSASGTFGFGMNAVDLMAAAASPRFPLSFAGAFPGPNFRTNLTLTDTSGRGTTVSLAAAGNDGTMGSSDFTIGVGANGHQQINFIGNSLGLFPYQTGALSLRPASGTAIAAVFAIDNRTNDSTYFPPDLPASSFARVIPAIGHLDGANGSRFRSDLYLFNPNDTPRTVMLEAKAWDSPEPSTMLFLTLLPNEARVIHDVLLTAFSKTGIARLRCTSQIPPSGGGVRITSRTYNVDPSGGTYGFLMPPLNNFQIGGSGDTLEILGAFADPGYRTNIGLVEMTPWPNNQVAPVHIEILDAMSRKVDSFDVNVPVAGGSQLNDIFKARSLTLSGPVLIRVSPTSGVIGAYATTTDNGTNDSSYLAANLGGKE